MEANGIDLFVVLDPDLKDTMAGFVYWQNPERWGDDRRLNRIRAGQMIDIKLSAVRPQRVIDSTQVIQPKEAKSDF